MPRAIALETMFKIIVCKLFYLQLMKVFKALLGEKLFALMMKQTFYGHFVAGEDRHKIIPTLER